MSDPEEYQIVDFQIMDDGETIVINGTEYECEPDIFNLIDYLFNDAVEEITKLQPTIEVLDELDQELDIQEGNYLPVDGRYRVQ